MKKALSLVFVAILVAGLGYGAYEHAQKSQDESIGNIPSKTEMRFRKLANGVIVHEEVPAVNVEELEPAAGDNQSPNAPRYRYDPLTQTYRVQPVDRTEDSGEDIIRDPRNP
jgi:hypothetical protein